MRLILRIILGLLAALLIGYVALDPPPWHKQHPYFTLLMLAIVVMGMILLESSLARRPKRKHHVHFLLPRPQLRSPFRGREDDLRSLHQFQNDSGQVIMVVGEPGVGKTALVSDYVMHHSDHFGFVAWQSLYDAPQMREVVNGWLRLLDESTPDMSLDSRVDFFLSELGQLRPKRALLVFDNAESVFDISSIDGKATPRSDFLRLLLRLAGTTDVGITIIITSTISFDPSVFRGQVQRLNTVTLRGLNTQDLRHVINDRFGAGAASDDVLALSAGNPSAAILLTDLQIREASQRKPHQPHGKDLGAILSRHLEALDSQQHAVLGFLSIARTPMSLEELQNALALTRSFRGTARNVVEELHSRHLVDKTQEEKFFAISIAAEVIIETLIAELITVITCHRVDTVRVLSIVPLDHVLWSGPLRNNSRRLIASVAASRIMHETNVPIGQLSGTDITAVFERIAEHNQGNLLLASNLLGFLVSQGASLSEIVFPVLSFIGIDFSRSHLFDVDFRACSLIDCTFADRIGAVNSVRLIDNARLLVGLASGSVELRNISTLSRIRRIEAHSEPVRAVHYFAKTDIIVSAGEDGRVNFYNGSRLELLKSLPLHECWVWRLLPAASIGHLFSIASDGSIGVIEIATQEVIGRASVPSRRLWGACIVADSMYVACEDGVLWRTKTTSVSRSASERSMPTWVIAARVDDPIKACCSVKEHVVFGCRNGRLYALDTQTGSIRTLSIEDGAVRDVCAGPREGTVISLGDSGVARSYDINTGELLAEFPAHQSRGWSLDADTKGFVVSGGDDRSIHLWDEPSGTPLRSVYGHGQSLRSIDFLGESLLLACADDFLRTGSVSPGAITMRPWFTPRPGRRILGAVALLEDRWACGLDDGELHIGDLSGSRLAVKAHSSSIECIARNATGDRFATGGEDRRIIIYDQEGRVAAEPNQLHSSRIWALDFSPRGDKLVSAGGDFIVAAWDARTGSVLWSAIGHSNLVLAARWIDDDRVVSAGTDGTMRLWIKGVCSAVIPIACVIRHIVTDMNGVVYGIGRRSDPEPGWMVVRWDIERGDLIQKEIGVQGGSARAGMLHKGQIFIGGDLPYLVVLDTSSLELQQRNRIPGPYSGMRIISSQTSGTDLESIALLGAETI